MFVFKKIFSLYVKCSLHIAFAIFCFLKIAQLSLNISSNFNLEASVFFGSIIGYNFLKNNGFWFSKNFNYIKKYDILIVTFLSSIGFIFYFLHLSSNKQIEFFKMAFIVLIYPFLRRFWFLKIGLVSFCITYIVTYIPTIDLKLVFNSFHFFQLKLFCLICALMIPFEIYDLQFDDIKLQTVVQKYGIKRTKFFGYLSLVVFLVLGCSTNQFLKFFIDLIIAIIIAISIRYSSINNSKYYNSFWVESIPIFWWLIMLLFV